MVVGVVGGAVNLVVALKVGQVHRDIGFADESAVVRTVMIENEKALSEYCKRHGLDFAEVTTEA